MPTSLPSAVLPNPDHLFPFSRSAHIDPGAETLRPHPAPVRRQRRHSRPSSLSGLLHRLQPKACSQKDRSLGPGTNLSQLESGHRPLLTLLGSCVGLVTTSGVGRRTNPLRGRALAVTAS